MKPLRFSARLLPCILALSAMPSCGYGIGYAKSGPVGTAKSVAVIMFYNKTHEAGTETLFTEALRNEFALGKTTVLTSRASAEITVTGTVMSLSSAPVAFIQGGKGPSIGEYTLGTSIYVEAKNNKSSKIIYTGTFGGEEQYLLANEPVGTEANRRLAMRRLASRVMKEAHDLMTAGF
ncbi:MAG: LptE family protein [Myxococcota bacterium]|jgi:hypothetical protein